MIESLLMSGFVGGEYIGQNEYSISGTYALKVPVGARKASMIAVGGGGGGSYIQSDSNYSAGHAGGGGGNLSYLSSISVKAGDILTIVVGSGGVVGDYGTNGTKAAGSGGLSSIKLNGLLIISASGGLGGTFSAFSNGIGGSPGVINVHQDVICFQGGQGGAGGTAWNNGGGVGLYGVGTSGIVGSPNGSIFGDIKAAGGGGCSGTNGMAGGVRIIFGTDRTYPDTRTFNE